MSGPIRRHVLQLGVRRLPSCFLVGIKKIVDATHPLPATTSDGGSSVCKWSPLRGVLVAVLHHVQSCVPSQHARHGLRARGGSHGDCQASGVLQQAKWLTRKHLVRAQLLEHEARQIAVTHNRAWGHGHQKNAQHLAYSSLLQVI